MLDPDALFEGEVNVPLFSCHSNQQYIADALWSLQSHSIPHNNSCTLLNIPVGKSPFAWVQVGAVPALLPVSGQL